MSGHSASAEKSGHSANKRNSDICEMIGLQILSQQDLEETLRQQQYFQNKVDALDSQPRGILVTHVMT